MEGILTPMFEHFLIQSMEYLFVHFSSGKFLVVLYFVHFISCFRFPEFRFLNSGSLAVSVLPGLNLCGRRRASVRMVKGRKSQYIYTFGYIYVCKL